VGVGHKNHRKIRVLFLDAHEKIEAAYSWQEKFRYDDRDFLSLDDIPGIFTMGAGDTSKSRY